MNEDTYRDKLNDLQLEVEELREKLAQSTMGQVNDLSQSTKTDTISRQAAIDALKSQLSDWNDDYNIPVRKSIENIERLPSAQPEIIRCEDCKHYEADIMGNPWGVCCHPDWITDNCGNLVDESGWCYRAERRGE